VVPGQDQPRLLGEGLLDLGARSRLNRRLEPLARASRFEHPDLSEKAASLEGALGRWRRRAGRRGRVESRTFKPGSVRQAEACRAIIYLDRCYQRPSSGPTCVSGGVMANRCP